MAVREINFDGLVGPSHNYAGLSLGNLAATQNAGTVSMPRAAALQGLAKMRALLRMGLVQGVLPPHERPHIPSLRKMGFVGSDPDVLAAANAASPLLLANVSSASAMWPEVINHCYIVALCEVRFYDMRANESHPTCYQNPQDMPLRSWLGVSTTSIGHASSAQTCKVAEYV